MGISVALSPTNPCPAHSFAKRAITNASFRTKKLPGSYKISVLSVHGVNFSFILLNDSQILECCAVIVDIILDIHNFIL